MQNQIKNAFILLLAVVAILSILAYLTDAIGSLKNVVPLIFAATAILFIGSILLWLVSWAMLLKGSKIGFARTALLGFACVFGALTPIQIGADALRSIKLKELGNVSYSESISASMVVKGIKFLLISLIASFAFFVSLFNPALLLWLKLALLSGFVVVLLATLLFLLPLKQSIGLKISALFKRLGNIFSAFNKLSDYFKQYSFYLQKIPPKSLAAVAVLAFLSLLLEFYAFIFSFLSANVEIPIASAVVLFSILVILERTPFLPRGIGAVEAVGFIFLSLGSFTVIELSPAQIAAVIIIFDAVRLVIPTIASLLIYGLFFSKQTDFTKQVKSI